ncbi:4-amino-4-deoxy-L-arabinose-phosphoundecaprenol flippase subunit ArnF [Pantoea sp. NPDC088449]|uniref:Probable 4-amino-4-deoxy-L-arabinose-phosphoundecaprenol flippase subunit ArnF n=1 Tax=Candidatus Pantoea floridensis TaxID=1938870 RepID=A0A286DM30_9GAMM|nr:4-amino-4-deoxy-L-arabinose-phosphoundecaprenol flippase subunit ArnF [Pantoea floridensis]PIF14722.1 undecaprenyl phosphate-alpha-L-ara4N flippase subunit ArnF [Enterobacteriaceae bacterium JKS000233]SOD59706.1 undecaprenyl phosphate-alpha-L-ara4N flippase subunit ArnF [Pantoea floridensis]HBZ15539.1 4-amino-4-deoxy-L-arabinose-phospho-UDP flippase [Pantoea sp.]
MKGLMLALCSVLLVSLAQLVLRTAMLDFPPLRELINLQHLKPLLLLAIGLGAYALSMVCWMLALRHLPLNRLYPLLSLSYVLVWLAAISLPIMGESFRWSSFAGVVLIVIGLLMVSLPRRK